MITGEELKSAVNPVEVIGRTVQLRKSGRRHVGLCPFHADRNPIFSVSEHGLWFCHGGLVQPTPDELARIRRAIDELVVARERVAAVAEEVGWPL